jgi:DNA polymerase III subunit alpha
MTSEELLWQWCRFGWKYRKMNERPQAEQDWCAARVKYEMQLITSKGFADFFLVTSDMVRWAKDAGIPMGPGRGSVAASVVSWLIRITEIYPYQYPHLMFERFLDVTRTDPPDIDLDISDERRHEVRDYMAGRYGSDCVGTVANFVRYRGKNSIDDVARVYNVPHYAKKIVSDLVIERSGGDSRFNATLEDTVSMFPNAARVFEEFPDLWQATRLEGNVRGMSIHAAGLIVSNDPLTDICAVYDREGRSVLSIDKYDCEYAGVLKLDLLGLSTMGVIQNCLDMAGLTLDDLYSIRDDDERALDVFRRLDVVGIFQYEGRATRLVTRDVRPDNFGEVVDINALSRPGPLFSGSTAEYCDVKHGRRKPERFHPLIDELTAHTKGQIIYQEQILKIVREIGGFDWTNANEIRRIIAKKIGEAAFNVSMGNFVEGAARIHGIEEPTAQRIWKRLVTSGTYAFVYAHSVSYSTLALWCAWLKAHYPLEFYAASLAKEADDEGRFKLMKDAQAHGIAITPPILNASRKSWRAVPSLGLVAGWQQIPGIGEKTADKIDELRWGPPYLVKLACGHEIRMETGVIYGGPVRCSECGSEVRAQESKRIGGKFTSWGDLQSIPGIGPKTVAKMQEFATSHDPFQLDRTERILQPVIRWVQKQHGIPSPTHNGVEIAAIAVAERYGADAKRNYGKGPRVVYAGLVREINYQDAVENRRSRSGEEVDDILKTMKRPDLLAYCSMRCYDTTDEEVYLRVNRFKFPEVKRTIENISVNNDVVICVGNRIAGFGTPVMVDRLYVVSPD